MPARRCTRCGSRGPFRLPRIGTHAAWPVGGRRGIRKTSDASVPSPTRNGPGKKPYGSSMLTVPQAGACVAGAGRQNRSRPFATTCDSAAASTATASRVDTFWTSSGD